MATAKENVEIVIKNEIHKRKKERKMKDVTTKTPLTNTSRITENEDITMLLKFIKKMKKKKKRKKIKKLQIESKSESTCSKRNEVKCNVCNQLFSKSYYLVHIKLHDDAIYKCDICDKTFSYISILKKHKAVHNNETWYKCDLCDKKFTYENGLITHKTFHEMESIRKCRFCFKKFDSYDNFYNHIKRYSFDKPFKCSLCKKTFKTSQNFTNHRKMNCEDFHNALCDICNINYAERTTVIKYIK